MDILTTTIDGVLLMTSGAAVIYCAALTQRLRRLHDLKSGVGEAILTLSRQIKASQEANARIGEEAHEAIGTLDAKIAALKSERQAAEDVLSAMDGQVSSSKSKLDEALAASEQVATDVVRVTERARVELHALNRAVEIANKVSELTKNNAAAQIPQAKRGGAVHRVGTERGRGPADNPFLHAKAG